MKQEFVLCKLPSYLHGTIWSIYSQNMLDINNGFFIGSITMFAIKKEAVET